MAESDMSRTWTGRCECGAIRYRVTEKMTPVVACHCGQCLRTHGNFAAYSSARRENVEIEGEANLSWYVSSDFARRGFCRTCGASLFWERLGSGVLGIAAGTLDKPTGLKMVAHIFVDDRSDYYEIVDDLERFPQRFEGERPGGAA